VKHIETTRRRCQSVAAILCLTIATSARADNQFGVGSIDRGLVVGAVVGVAAAAGVGITVLVVVLHNRGVAAGCIVESAGKKTLVGSDKRVYTLLGDGPFPPPGERVKLKGHKSGRSSDRSFQVEKVLKDYGKCQP
jgi:hypothetical protein